MCSIKAKNAFGCGTASASGPGEPSDFRDYSGDSKLTPLLPVEVRGRPEPDVVAFIAEVLKPQGGCRVLDFGCGRGVLVAQLRGIGLEAYGVEVDKRYIDAGGSLFKEMLGDRDVLTLLDLSGCSVFPDGYFDVVISDQVLEHVRDLDVVAREVSRVLRPGGFTYHKFPARHRPIEVHYRLPFVHWLPKARIRWYLIRVLLLMGLRGALPTSLDQNTKTDLIYRFSCENTFYRSRSEISACFGSFGISVEFDTANREWIRRKLSGLPSHMLTRIEQSKMLGLLLKTFRECRMIGCKA